MTALRLQVRLESTHRPRKKERKKTNPNKNKRDQLVDRKKSHLSIQIKLLL
jgi:hypothetical protein